LSNSSTEEEVKAIEANYNMDAEQIIADQRYDFVTKPSKAIAAPKKKCRNR
jgi:hypothetical protein